MTYKFEVRTGEGEPRPGTIGKKGDVCVLTGSPITREYIRGEGKAGRMAIRLMAIVAEGQRGRIYLSPTGDHERLALDVKPPDDVLNTEIIGDMRYLTPVSYGMNTHRSLYTYRQLVTLTAFCDLVQEARAKALEDSAGDQNYADAVATFLGMWISRFVDLNNALCQWRSDPAKQHVGHLFARQAIPIVWDFAEANALGSSAGSFDKTFLFVPKVVEGLAAAPCGWLRATKECDRHRDGRPTIRVFKRPALLRQRALCGLVGFFLRLATTLSSASLSSTPWHSARAKGR